MSETMTTTGPERIWLQRPSDDPLDPYTTWADDEINDTDVEYVRADIHAALCARVRELETLVARAEHNASVCAMGCECARDTLRGIAALAPSQPEAANG